MAVDAVTNVSSLVVWLTFVASVVSLAATSVVLLAFFRSAALRSLPARLQATTSFVDGAWFTTTTIAAGNGLAGFAPIGSCTGVGFIVVFCALASQGWAVAIFVNLRRMLADPASSTRHVQRDERVFHCVIWLTAGLVALIPTLCHVGLFRISSISRPTYVQSVYGTCSIGVPWLRALTQGVPAAFVISYMLLTTRWALDRVIRVFPDDVEAARRVRVRCTRYIVVFVLAWAAVIIEDTCVLAMGDDRLPSYFSAVRAVLFYSQGAFNAVIYAANKGSILVDALPHWLAIAMRLVLYSHRIRDMGREVESLDCQQPEQVARTVPRNWLSPAWTSRWGTPRSNRNRDEVDSERAALLAHSRYGLRGTERGVVPVPIGPPSPLAARSGRVLEIGRRNATSYALSAQAEGRRGSESRATIEWSPGSSLSGAGTSGTTTPLAAQLQSNSNGGAPTMQRVPSMMEVMAGRDPWGILASPLHTNPLQREHQMWKGEHSLGFVIPNARAELVTVDEDAVGVESIALTDAPRRSFHGGASNARSHVEGSLARVESPRVPSLLPSVPNHNETSVFSTPNNRPRVHKVKIDDIIPRTYAVVDDEGAVERKMNMPLTPFTDAEPPSTDDRSLAKMDSLSPRRLDATVPWSIAVEQGAKMQSSIVKVESGERILVHDTRISRGSVVPMTPTVPSAIVLPLVRGKRGHVESSVVERDQTQQAPSASFSGHFMLNTGDRDDHDDGRYRVLEDERFDD